MNGFALEDAPAVRPTDEEMKRLVGLARSLCSTPAQERDWLSTGRAPATVTAGASIVLGRQRRAYDPERLGWFRYERAALAEEAEWCTYWRARGWDRSRADDRAPAPLPEQPAGEWVVATWDEARMFVHRNSATPVLL